MYGACAPNINGPFTKADLDIIEAGRFGSVKLRAYHDRANILQLRERGVRHFLGMWPDFSIGDKWEAHAELCWQTVMHQYPYCNIWLTGNEPNRPEAWQGKPWQYANYLTAIIKYVRRKAEAVGFTIYYVLPPLSYGGDMWQELAEWRKAFRERPDSKQLLWALREYHQYAGANAYWEFEHLMLDGSYGMCWPDVAAWSELPVILTEFGYAGLKTGAEKSYERGHALMRHQYPIYQAEVHKRGAVASYVFAVGGTVEWAGYAIPLEVAQAMAPLPA